MRWLKKLVKKARRNSAPDPLTAEQLRIQQESDHLRVEMLRAEAEARALMYRLSQKGLGAR